MRLQHDQWPKQICIDEPCRKGNLTRDVEEFWHVEKKSATITGRRRKEIRAKKKATQRKVAEAVNVSESLISKYENGITDPAIGTLLLLAQLERCASLSNLKEALARVTIGTTQSNHCGTTLYGIS